MTRETGNTRGPKWKGPPGLSAAEKKRWSENHRQAKLKKDPAWVAKEKDRQQRREEKRNRERLPTEEFLELVHAGMHVQRGTRGSTVSYLDAHGNLHRDDNRSAEQLIADFLAAEEKRRKEGRQ